MPHADEAQGKNHDRTVAQALFSLQSVGRRLNGLQNRFDLVLPVF